MKKKIAIFCTIGSFLIISDSINAGQMFMMFLFNGIIPGTELSISPTLMMLLMFAAGVFVIVRSNIRQTIQKYGEIKEVTAKTTSRRKLKHA